MRNAAVAALALFAACTSPEPGAAPAPAAGTPATARAPEESHPFSVHDMLAMRRISDPRLSPDGNWVLFGLRKTDLEANRGRSDLWITSVLGGEPRQLTEDPASDYSGRWLPDGSGVVFLSTRGGSAQVWRIGVQSGRARGGPEQVSDLPLDVGGMEVFPDGRRLALAMDVYVDAETLQETADRDAALVDAPSRARIYDSLLFRHWDSWEDGKRSHVFTWRMGGGEPIDLMRGVDADCPTRPFGGTEQIAIAPDGEELVLAYKDVGAEAAWSTNVDLWSVSADGSQAPRCLTADNPAWDDQPVFSPDGRWLAWTAMERPGYESDRMRLVLMDRASGERSLPAADWDRSVGEIVWSPDAASVYTSATDLGGRSLFRINLADGEVTTLVDYGTNRSPMITGDRLLYAHDSLSMPLELRSVDLNGMDKRDVTSFNARRLASVRMGEASQFSLRGAQGDVVHGWLVKPVDFDPQRRYPVAFLIHGGPQGSFGDHFHYRWNPQVYAGAGYAVVFVDFHGSTGYGQEYTDSINQDWGGKPYRDLMQGLDHVLEQNPFLDGDRVAALGASYGGYMINWVAGQTDRFRCLVNHDGVFDTRSMYFETEELWFPEFDFGGTPWSNPKGFADWNPAEHVENWKTPMLVIQGALDFRVPESQAFGAFTALQRRGVPSKLLYFPDENHWVLKPHNSIVWHQTVLEWLEHWTG